MNFSFRFLPSRMSLNSLKHGEWRTALRNRGLAQCVRIAADAGSPMGRTVVLRRMIYQSRKIEAGELRGARYIRATRTYSAARITLARESTRTRCLNSAIYQALLSSEPFHVAINVSTAGTSYFKALWHRHAHAKFTSRRLRISAAFSPCISIADPAIYRLSR